MNFFFFCYNNITDLIIYFNYNDTFLEYSRSLSVFLKIMISNTLELYF